MMIILMTMLVVMANRPFTQNLYDVLVLGEKLYSTVLVYVQ